MENSETTSANSPIVVDSSSDIKDQARMETNPQGVPSAVAFGSAAPQENPPPGPPDRCLAEKDRLLADMSVIGSFLSKPQSEMTKVTVEGQVFVIHKSVLVNGGQGRYWDKALNGRFMESNGEITLEEDVQAGPFGLYVDVLYHVELLGDNFNFFNHYKGGKLVNVLTLLHLWRLGDRFLHDPIKVYASYLIEQGLKPFDEAAWHRREARWDEMHERILYAGRMLEKSYDLCCKYNVPYAERVLEAVANAGCRSYALFTDNLSMPFMIKVGVKSNSRAVQAQLENDSRKSEPVEARPAKRTKTTAGSVAQNQPPQV